VLFDLDGTLTDPAVGIVRSLEAGLALVGRSLPEQPRRFIGPPLQDSLAKLGCTAAEIDTVIDGYRQRYASVGMRENRVYEGIPEVLTELSQAGCVLAVATSKPEYFAVPILEQFGLRSWFTVVAGATLDGVRRHKADVIAHGLAQLPVAPALMVGDRAEDVAGAAAHGVPAVGVTWGYGSARELERAGAWRVAGEPAHVARLVLELPPL
jgi:phosphoglycolate phosphatase